MKYGTLDYYKIYTDALSKDEQHSKSGLTTTMLYIFTDVKTEADKPKAFLVKIDNGKAAAIEVSADEKAEFIFTAPYAKQAAIAKGEMGAREIGPKLNMMKAIKHGGTLKRMGAISKELKDVEY